jgi:hypothetical protein
MAHKEANQKRYRESAKGIATRRAYEERTRERNKARKRAYYQANRDTIIARTMAYHRQNRELRLMQMKLSLLRVSHGMFPGDWAALWAAQDGQCYLCGELMDPEKKLDIDHDHSCWPKDKSCRACRRGLAHSECNCLIGLAGDDPDRLRRIADALERAQAKAAERMAQKPSQLELGEVI